MKGAFFNKPLEWSIETPDESWQQGSKVKGTLKVKNHGTETVSLSTAGAGLAYTDIKKVHAKTEGVLKPAPVKTFEDVTLGAGESKELSFELELPANCPVSDKKATYFLTYGRDASENHLQLNIQPRALFGKLTGLLDTFYRFKLKEFKGTKNGVEYKLIPPTARDMANLDSLLLAMEMEGETLNLTFEFQVKKLDTSGVTNSIKKETARIKRSLAPKEYSLGRDMINQDALLKMFEGVIGEVKIKNAF
jgi:sporulation-control protein spo0M